VENGGAKSYCQTWALFGSKSGAHLKFIQTAVNGAISGVCTHTLFYGVGRGLQGCFDR
jgi:hypothetical protein